MIWNIPKITELKKLSFSELQTSDGGANLQVKKLGSQSSIYLLFKRIFDIVFSLFVLVFFAPLWLIIIILIRLNSKGSALFCHERVGQNGKLFKLYKFRTMQSGVKDQEFSPTNPNDPRITPIGKFLRRTSLDEVPQFYNVLKSEMSIVGPRPEMQFIVNMYNTKEKARLLVKPGITGLWQIHGRKDLPLHENVEYDLYYILHQSLLMDLIILLKTVNVVIKGKGAY